MKRHLWLLAVLLSATFMPSAEAASQTPEREGFVFGIGFGVGKQMGEAKRVDNGETKGAGNDIALPLQLQLGYSVVPRVAVVLGAYGSGTGQTVNVYRVGKEFRTKIFGVIGPAVQVQVYGPTWARVGGGYSVLSDTNLSRTDRTGFGLTLAAGVSLVRRSTLTFDVEARYLYGSFGKTVEFWQDGNERDVSRTSTSYALVFSVNTW